MLYSSKSTTKKYFSMLLFLSVAVGCVVAVLYNLISIDYLRRLQQSSLIIIFISKVIVSKIFFCKNLNLRIKKLKKILLKTKTFFLILN